MIIPDYYIEELLLQDEELVRGLNWGFPRNGHPEGITELHVIDILKQIDDNTYSKEWRKSLRTLAITHDSFKHLVVKGSSDNHGKIARNHVTQYIADTDLLNMIEYHDKPYSIWKTLNETNKYRENAFNTMMNSIVDKQLFLEFVKLDGSVKGKSSEPRDWFENKVKGYKMSGTAIQVRRVKDGQPT